jgi:AmmeMemoRadiSam system protein A
MQGKARLDIFCCSHPVGVLYLSQILRKFKQDFPQTGMGVRLSDSERRLLLQVARCAVEAAVNGTSSALPDDVPDILRQPAGAFVTLRIGDELRGCIGYIESTCSLIETVEDAAAKAALDDIRFSPVTSEELPTIDIEISVLSPIEQIDDPEKVEVGRHGLIVEYGGFRGLLLPQVPLEHGWDRETFLNQTCRKAGLPLDVWQSPTVKLYTFTAEVFGEEPQMKHNKASRQ